jgi:uncharacterized membrane protein YoaK (UPF0700 family)
MNFAELIHKKSFLRAFIKIVKLSKFSMLFELFLNFLGNSKFKLSKSFFKLFFAIFPSSVQKKIQLKLFKEMQISHIENSYMIKKKKNSNDLKSGNFL